MKVVRLLVVLSSIISCFAYCGCNSSNGQHFLTWTAVEAVDDVRAAALVRPVEISVENTLNSLVFGVRAV